MPFCQKRETHLPNIAEWQISGPMQAPMPLRAGRHRGQLLIESATRRNLHTALRPWWIQLSQLPSARKVRWSIDVDPVDLY
jgi:primosomal protein N' (replication factor Y)